MRRILNAKYLLAGAVSLAALLVYLPALRNGFVQWDDGPYVVENIHIRSFDAALLRWAFTTFYECNWHPLTWISHAADYAVWGLNPLGHHLTNIILHAVNTLLVVVLAVRLLGMGRERAALNGRPSFLTDRTILIAAGTTGLLFGLHPLQVESVAWVSERKNVLSFLFFLLSILSYTKHVSSRQSAVDRRQSFRPYILTLVFFILALLSKPMAITLPVVLLILDWYPFQRIVSVKTFRAALIEKLHFFACVLISSVLTILAQRAAMAALEVVPFETRLLVAMKSTLSYLGKMLWPDVIPFYPYPGDARFSLEYAALFVLIMGITVLCVLLAKKQKLWLAAWAYYVTTLIPVLGIIQVGRQAMADRYMYFPSLGPFFLAGLVTARVASDLGNRGRGTVLRGIGVIVVLAAIAGISSVTIRQISVWKDSFSLWDYVIKKEPESAPMGYNGRGLVYDSRGLYDEAVADFNKALALNPMYLEAYNNRASVLLKTGQVDKAIADYQKAIALYPSRYEAYFNLGLIYGRTGFTDAAVGYFSKAIGANPQYAAAYKNRGILLAEAGQNAKALDDFNSALALDRDAGAVYIYRGNLYVRMGNNGLAAADFQKACSLGEKNGCTSLQQVTR